MERKDRLDAYGVTTMLGFALLFAFNQVVIKITLDGIQPIFSAGLRSFFGLGALLVWMWWRKVPITMTRGQLWGGILVGVLFSTEFLCIFIALDMTSVSRASVIFYTMPIWLGLAAHFFLPDERLTGLRLLGFVFAICGVTWAFLDRTTGQSSLLGDFLALLGAMGWAGIALTLRLTPVSTASAEMQVFIQLVISVIFFFLISPFFGPLIREFEMVHVAGLLFQSVIIVLFGFMLWFSLMKVYPASDIASFSFLTPVLAVFLGWLILGDDVGIEILGALALVCAGLYLISRRPKAKS